MAATPEPLSANEHNRLLARIAALEADLAEARGQVARAESLAHEDPLTGVLNRRGFARELERAVAFHSRYDTPVSVMLFDIDGLKRVNDRYGHAAGDALIAGVARTLKRNLRVSDSLGRLGGDEFGVLVWHAAEEVAIAKSKQLQVTLDASSATWSTGPLPLCASVGVAEITRDGGADVALTLADQRLYADKSARRPEKKVA
ncbi:GGDEF domain-containing protein [Terrarubrum flagellatum]|uniref:GGDEF domain-containing protein n=1 Tax=Terrirubrum flagellatum TaxID=2895980 RepID=UPI003145374F